MPAQFLPGAVAVLSYAGTQAFDLRDKHLQIEVQKVLVRVVASLLEFAVATSTVSVRDPADCGSHGVVIS